MSYSAGDVVMVDLEPVMGSEQGRRRPCVVVSNLKAVTASRSRPLFVIVPLTRSDKLMGSLAPRIPARAGGLPADSTALVMHLRSIDPRRILGTVGKLNSSELQKMMAGIRELFGIS